MKPTEPLVERMFSGFGHPHEVPHATPQQRPSESVYHPLRQSKGEPGTSYRLKIQSRAVRVTADSAAIDVMTDLSRVAAATIDGHATIDEAHHAMIAHGVRALFVVEAGDIVRGIITATDVLGERPIQFAEQRGLRHAEVLVRDVMTAAELLEVMAFDDVLHARVGDVVAALRLSGRQHALVIESAEQADGTAAMRTVRGIFSVTQIARQLGLPLQLTHDVARTFAEIEAAIGA
jgi:CBS domain protein